ncbi:MAG: prolipoprotein diacylglyceryl transferase [Chromatiales bacterium]|nr:prolipoprotein diacylglyceryl transferase [Chromatiales bacterium]
MAVRAHDGTQLLRGDRLHRAAACRSGSALGRIGNFINGELWGKRRPTLPWAHGVPRRSGSAAAPSVAALPVRRSRALVLFVILWRFTRQAAPDRQRVRPVPRSATASSAFWSSSCASRIAQLGYLAFGWLTMGQVLSLPMIAVGIGLMVWAGQREAE